MTLEEYFDLGEYRNTLRPEAAGEYDEFLDSIRSKVDLNGLTIDDVKEYLSSDLDRWIFDNGVKALQEWLSKCRFRDGESPSSSCPYTLPYECSCSLKSVIIRAARAKKREEEIRAAEVRMANEVFLANMDELHRKARANEQCQQYVADQVAEGIKFTEDLARKKRPEFGYPSWLAPYEPHEWFDTSPLNGKIKPWVSPVVKEKIPQSLRQFTTWDLGWYTQALPEATYGVLGVPCLTWGYKAVVLAQVDLALKSMEYPKEFCGYQFSMHMEKKKLGRLYIGPESMGSYPEDFSTPIALLSLLAQGEMEGPGIQVVERDSNFITFRIQGFEEETVFLHDTFRGFIKDLCDGKTLAEALLEKGIIDADTAKLVEAKWGEPLPVAVEPAVCKADPQGVQDKLLEIGWSQEKAAKAVKGVQFSPNATVDDVVKMILAEA